MSSIYRRGVFVFLVFVAFAFQMHAAKAEGVTPLVNTNWLASNLKRPDLVVLDIRGPNSIDDPFSKGHIPGARSAPYNMGWRERRDGLIGMLPSQEKIVSHIRTLGVSNSSHVVIVPHGVNATDFGAATRVYWTFKVLGHDLVSILDGGHQAWMKAGGETSTKPIEYELGDFDGEIDRRLIATQAQVQSSLKGGASLVDARPVDQYKGIAKSPVVARVGTIPGALNLPYTQLYKPDDARFASRAHVKSLAAKANIRSDSMAKIAFCNTGHWASLAWFALSEIKGDPNVSLYDGSMTEWARNAENLVEVLKD